MLKSLYIKNYALIDSLEIDFISGFSVITGETGAGKSIILGALSLILGQRADMKAIKQGEEKCIIEGVFDVSAYDLKDFCEENDIEYDAESYILRREILSAGKSRSFINDSPASLNDLKVLGEQLIDIHSQHENLLLSDNNFQMQVVDIMAGNKKLLSDYTTAFTAFKKLEQSLKIAKEEIAKSEEEKEFFHFQYLALDEASLVEGEQGELEQELATLNHAEDIKTGLYKIHLLLSGDDTGIVVSLKDGLSTAQSLTKVYHQAEEIASRLQSAYIDLKDMSADMERLSEDVEFSPERLSFVQERLDLIYTLQTRHKLDSIAELLALKKELKEKLDFIDSSDENLQKIEKELAEKKKIVMDLSAKLTKQRKEATKSIEKKLIERISILGMPNVRFECAIQSKKEPDIKGADNLEFLFSANKSMPLQPVAQVASGGEISRFMLCLKSMIAGATALPSIVFDEVDTGVSGEIADKMGDIMQEFGQNMQVLAITHLPQIAAKGKAHYKVYKVDAKDRTTTNLIRLTDEQRLDEIAGMLSGATVTDAAKQNAKVMLGFK